MPTYDYECTKGHRTEVMEKMSEPRKSCPRKGCDAKAVRMVSGGAGIRVKGGTPKFH